MALTEPLAIARGILGNLPESFEKFSKKGSKPVLSEVNFLRKFASDRSGFEGGPA